jgi:hypothetical protein
LVKDHVHYEVAFEHYLQAHQIPYVAVDEGKKATFRDAKLKSFDFIVYSASQTNWLVDIKGRRWVPRKRGGKPAWENWITEDDREALGQWSEVFGVGFAALLVFAYWLPPGAEPPAEVTHVYNGQLYVFAAVPLETYGLHARLRSPKWGTINMPTAEFARHVRPVRDWL